MGRIGNLIFWCGSGSGLFRQYFCVAGGMRSPEAPESFLWKKYNAVIK
jgi:hypothetical protein